MRKRIWAAAALSLALAACGSERTTGKTAAAGEARAGAITQETLATADTNTADWLSHGRTWSEQRHSPLDQINRDTVERLSLAWHADLDTARGQEATPLVIDGRLYTTTAWSKVKAYNAATGEPLWEYDPDVPGAAGAKACCDVVNRGLAAWGGKLYLGTLDGRLIALDRDTGEPAWTAQTIERDGPYTITGAPRAANGLVFIGNGGADMGAVRGYVSSYDAETGELAWRFHTVPDNPANGEQPAHLERAAETWTGEWWEMGGGGTVWDSMAYDGDLGLIYIGVGNGAPWNQQYRSPGGGDNLYLSSIVAIHADTGEYAWHFQTTPGETWDYTATQHIILADLDLGGETRKVLMQAPKNGFFYVIDRETGKFISAENYTRVTWALGIDPETGRPVENPAARYRGGTALVFPSALGGHNWHPMAFSPDEGLVYIPAQNAPQPYSSPAEWTPQPLGWNNAVSRTNVTGSANPDARTYRRAESQAEEAGEPPAGMQPVKPRQLGPGALIAWDPAAQEERWRVDYRGLWNGGLLSTGGGLVFQGIATGEFRAYDAADGSQLWSYPVQTGAIAAPVTYSVDGEQYVALMAGWGGVYGLLAGTVENRSRLLVFKLDGTDELPPEEDFARVLDPPALDIDTAAAARGGELYGRYCTTCHGGGTVLPDLKYSAALDRESAWLAVMKDGVLEPNGMVSFAPVLSEEEMLAIRQFIVARAQAEAEE